MPKDNATLNEYLFDVRLFASFRLYATSEREARDALRDLLDCATVNAGEWPDGTPAIGEASADGDAELIEVNGQ